MDKPLHLRSVLEPSPRLEDPDTPRPDPRVERIVALRLQGKTWLEICADVGISHTTLMNLRDEYALDASMPDSAASSLPVVLVDWSPELLELARAVKRDDRREKRLAKQRARIHAETGLDPIDAAIARARQRDADKAASAASLPIANRASSTRIGAHKSDSTSSSAVPQKRST